VAHQGCLLEWASEVNSKKDNGDGMPRCPQCRSIIYVRKRTSRFVEIRDTIEAIERSGLQLAILSSITGAVVSAAYTTLYAIGIASIRCVCPSDMALRILGIRATATAIEMEPLTLRRMFLIPSIPFVIIACGSRGTFANTVAACIPLAVLDRKHPPWNLRGPRLTLALIPAARIAYFLLYDAVVDPIIQVCAAQVRPSVTAGNDDDDEPLIDVEIRVDAVDGQIAIENGQHVDGQQLDQQQANNGDGHRGHRGHAALWVLVQPLFHLLVGDDAADGVDATGGAPQSNDWIISRRSAVRRLGRVLLLPALSGLVGGVLSVSPFVRRVVPSRFNRNMLGGAVVIFIRDIVNIATALLRVSQENSRRVLNHFEAEALSASEQANN
jgi:hypothetical protein